MDSDLAWVNGKSGRQSWRYHANAFQRSIISEAIYHLTQHRFTACKDSLKTLYM